MDEIKRVAYDAWEATLANGRVFSIACDRVTEKEFKRLFDEANRQYLPHQFSGHKAYGCALCSFSFVHPLHLKEPGL